MNVGGGDNGKQYVYQEYGVKCDWDVNMLFQDQVKCGKCC